MTKENNAIEVHFNGPKGQTIFNSPLIACLANDTMYYLQQNMKERINYIDKLNDITSIVVVSSLLVENIIDDLLSSIMPGFDELRNHYNVTFSVKIAIVRSLRIVPTFILNDSDTIRKIRNEFAHNITIDDFDKLSPKLIQKMDNQIKTLNPAHDINEQPLKRFQNFTFLVTWSLQTYKIHVQRLNDFIRENEFIKKFQEYCIKEKGGIDPKNIQSFINGKNDK